MSDHSTTKCMSIMGINDGTWAQWKQMNQSHNARGYFGHSGSTIQHLHSYYYTGGNCVLPHGVCPPQIIPVNEPLPCRRATQATFDPQWSKAWMSSCLQHLEVSPNTVDDYNYTVDNITGYNTRCGMNAPNSRNMMYFNTDNNYAHCVKNITSYNTRNTVAHSAGHCRPGKIGYNAGNKLNRNITNGGYYNKSSMCCDTGHIADLNTKQTRTVGKTKTYCSTGNMAETEKIADYNTKNAGPVSKITVCYNAGDTCMLETGKIADHNAKNTNYIRKTTACYSVGNMVETGKIAHRNTKNTGLVSKSTVFYTAGDMSKTRKIAYRNNKNAGRVTEITACYNARDMSETGRITRYNTKMAGSCSMNNAGGRMMDTDSKKAGVSKIADCNNASMGNIGQIGKRIHGCGIRKVGGLDGKNGPNIQSYNTGGMVKHGSHRTLLVPEYSPRNSKDLDTKEMGGHSISQVMAQRKNERQLLNAATPYDVDDMKKMGGGQGAIDMNSIQEYDGIFQMMDQMENQRHSRDAGRSYNIDDMKMMQTSMMDKDQGGIDVNSIREYDGISQKMGQKETKRHSRDAGRPHEIDDMKKMQTSMMGRDQGGIDMNSLREYDGISQKMGQMETKRHSRDAGRPYNVDDMKNMQTAMMGRVQDSVDKNSLREYDGISQKMGQKETKKHSQDAGRPYSMDDMKKMQKTMTGEGKGAIDMNSIKEHDGISQILWQRENKRPSRDAGRHYDMDDMKKMQTVPMERNQGATVTKGSRAYDYLSQTMAQLQDEWNRQRAARPYDINDMKRMQASTSSGPHKALPNEYGREQEYWRLMHNKIQRLSKLNVTPERTKTRSDDELEMKMETSSVTSGGSILHPYRNLRAFEQSEKSQEEIFHDERFGAIYDVNTGIRKQRRNFLMNPEGNVPFYYYLQANGVPVPLLPYNTALGYYISKAYGIPLAKAPPSKPHYFWEDQFSGTASEVFTTFTSSEEEFKDIESERGPSQEVGTGKSFSDQDTQSDKPEKSFSYQNTQPDKREKSFSYQVTPSDKREKSFSYQDTPSDKREKSFSYEVTPSDKREKSFSYEVTPSDKREKSFSYQDTPSDKREKSFSYQDTPSDKREKSFSYQDTPSDKREKSFSYQDTPSDKREKSFSYEVTPSDKREKSFSYQDTHSHKVSRSSSHDSKKHKDTMLPPKKGPSKPNKRKTSLSKKGSKVESISSSKTDAKVSSSPMKSSTSKTDSKMILSVSKTESKIVLSLAKTDSKIVPQKSPKGSKILLSPSKTDSKIILSMSRRDSKSAPSQSKTDSKIILSLPKMEAKIVPSQSQEDSKIILTPSDADSKLIIPLPETNSKTSSSQAETDSNTLLSQSTTKSINDDIPVERDLMTFSDDELSVPHSQEKSESKTSTEYKESQSIGESQTLQSRISIIDNKYEDSEPTVYQSMEEEEKTAFESDKETIVTGTMTAESSLKFTNRASFTSSPITSSTASLIASINSSGSLLPSWNPRQQLKLKPDDKLAALQKTLHGAKESHPAGLLFFDNWYNHPVIFSQVKALEQKGERAHMDYDALNRE